ncbi:MAG: hypothetical protein ABIO85_00370 [Sphingomicrobium sp.]
MQQSRCSIRADDPRVHDSHAGLAKRYGRASRALIAKLDAKAEGD